QSHRNKNQGCRLRHGRAGQTRACPRTTVAEVSDPEIVIRLVDDGVAIAVGGEIAFAPEWVVSCIDNAVFVVVARHGAWPWDNIIAQVVLKPDTLEPHRPGKHLEVPSTQVASKAGARGVKTIFDLDIALNDARTQSVVAETNRRVSAYMGRHRIQTGVLRGF